MGEKAASYLCCADVLWPWVLHLLVNSEHSMHPDMLIAWTLLFFVYKWANFVISWEVKSLISRDVLFLILTVIMSRISSKCFFFFFWKDPLGVEESNYSLLWILCICQSHFLFIYFVNFSLLPQRPHATSAWKFFAIEFNPLKFTVMQMTLQHTKSTAF